jgi:hypothetical protein
MNSNMLKSYTLIVLLIPNAQFLGEVGEYENHFHRTFSFDRLFLSDSRLIGYKTGYI